MRRFIAVCLLAPLLAVCISGIGCSELGSGRYVGVWLAAGEDVQLGDAGDAGGWVGSVVGTVLTRAMEPRIELELRDDGVYRVDFIYDVLGAEQRSTQTGSWSADGEALTLVSESGSERVLLRQGETLVLGNDQGLRIVFRRPAEG